MPVDTPMTNEMERTPYVTESLRVRCPACRKLYLVQFGDIQEAKPRFECVQCRSRFWLSLPDMDLTTEITGIPLQVKEAPAKARTGSAAVPGTSPASSASAAVAVEKEPCPKCFKPVAVGAAECGACGVLIAKAKESALSFTESRAPAHSVQLEALWKKVIADYGDERLHAEFVGLAQKERALPYAAAQYGQMAKLMPTDELTEMKIREIQALADAMIPSRERAALSEPRRFSRLWQLPLFAAALLIIAGMWVPFFRNLVGVGAAFLFLAVAFQMQFRKRG